MFIQPYTTFHTVHKTIFFKPTFILIFILLFRFFAPQLNTPDINNDLLNLICCILKEMEDHVLSIVQKMMKHLAEVCHYFIINSLCMEGKLGDFPNEQNS